MRGSPSPWNVFARMASEAPERETRLRVSVRERDVAGEAWGEPEGAMVGSLTVCERGFFIR